jgi:aminoglycoside phosphotransferase (APT) family kinase protein
MTDMSMLDSYLAVIGKNDAESEKQAQLLHGQFHDVVLLGEVAYRFPRDEESRRLLPGRAAVLTVLGRRHLPVEIPRVLSEAAVSLPLGRCHVALHRVPGQPVGRTRIADPPAASAMLSGLARLLDRLSDLGSDAEVRGAVPRSDRRLWERFAEDVATVLFPLMTGQGRALAQEELNRVLAIDLAGEALVHGDLGTTNLLWADADTKPSLASVLDWDGAHLGSQAEDLASIAATFGWPFARRLDAMRHAGNTRLISDAQAIAGTFALQQALPAALSGDGPSLADGLIPYHD